MNFNVMTNTRANTRRDEEDNAEKKFPFKVPHQAPPQDPIDPPSMTNVGINSALLSLTRDIMTQTETMTAQIDRESVGDGCF